jgi:UDP-glucose 4-epimerase
MTARRVVVTGASGYIGRPLVAALMRAGFIVRAATRRPEAVPAGCEVAEVADFKRDIDWDTIVCDADYVIHAAGLAHADTRNVAFGEHGRINWLQTQSLVFAAKRAKVSHFIYISSARAQVGPSAPRPIDETNEPAPTDDYGRSKLAGEMALRAAELPFTILRPTVIYGPNPKGNVKALLRLAAMPLPLSLAGFQSRRSMLGIDNLISAIFFVLGNPAALGEVFLVADPGAFTLDQIFTMLRQAQGRAPGWLPLPSALLRWGLVLMRRRYLWQRLNEDLVVDTGKLEKLGWQPTVCTFEGIRAMIRGETAAVPVLAVAAG